MATFTADQTAGLLDGPDNPLEFSLSNFFIEGLTVSSRVNFNEISPHLLARSHLRRLGIDEEARRDSGLL